MFIGKKQKKILYYTKLSGFPFIHGVLSKELMVNTTFT